MRQRKRVFEEQLVLMLVTLQLAGWDLVPPKTLERELVAAKLPRSLSMPLGAHHNAIQSIWLRGCIGGITP